MNLEGNAPIPMPMPSLFYEDCSPEALAQYIAEGWPTASVWSDEAGIVVGGRGMSDESVMRYLGLLNRLWDGNTFERHRTTAKSFSIKGRRLTCSLMMQHVVLCRLLGTNSGASRGMGFLARFLLAWPDSTMGTRFYREFDMNGPEMAAWDQRLEELLAIPLPVEPDSNMILTPRTLMLSDAARNEWIDFHDGVEKELGRLGEFADLTDFAAKTAENAARIAGILWTVQNGPEGEIDAAMMQAGAALASWHLGEARRIIGAAKVPQETADAMLLVEWMQQENLDETNPRDILRLGPNRLRDKTLRDAAVKLLIEKHHLIEIQRKGGTLLRLHPQLRGGENVEP